MALNEHDVEVLIGMVGGRVNVLKSDKKVLDAGERDRLVREYEEVQVHLLQLQRDNGWGRWAEDANRGVTAERASEDARLRREKEERDAG